MSDAASWHTLSITLPFPTPENAELVKRVVQVDPLLRPSESTRDLAVEGSSLLISIKSKTLAQARVALDHLLSDVQLIVQTMHTFAPKIKVDGQTGAVETPQTSDTMEVGLMGSWTGVKR